MLNGSANQLKINDFKKKLEEWHQLNETIIAFYIKYGKKVEDDSFIREHKSEYETFTRVSTHSSQQFEALLAQIKIISDSIIDENYHKLQKDRIMGILTLLLIASVVIFIALAINHSIKNSVIKAKNACEQIRLSKALHVKIETGTHDEINDTMQSINMLLTDIFQAISEAKCNAVQNASVAEELSSISLQIGHRAEEEAKVVKNAQHNVTLINKAVIEKIDSINMLSSSNARSVEEIAGAAAHLFKLSASLSTTLSQFKTA